MYIRVVKPRAWVRLADGGAVAIDEAVAELTRQGPRASVFACSSRTDLELVAVGFSAGRPHPQPLHFVSVHDEDLGVAGVEVLHSEGRTPLPEANRLHRDLDLSGERARRLVAHLAARRVSVETVREGELKRLARALHAAGQPIPAESWLLR